MFLKYISTVKLFNLIGTGIPANYVMSIISDFYLFMRLKDFSSFYV